jgi:rRNA pseudouridine-1189 N-methylase Emg1 (Nep1/Mra1 family)
VYALIVDALQAYMRLHNRGQAALPKEIAADDSEECCVVAGCVPSSDQILTGYIILFFPCRNHIDK